MYSNLLVFPPQDRSLSGELNGSVRQIIERQRTPDRARIGLKRTRDAAPQGRGAGRRPAKEAPSCREWRQPVMFGSPMMSFHDLMGN